MHALDIITSGKMAEQKVVILRVTIVIVRVFGEYLEYLIVRVIYDSYWPGRASNLQKLLARHMKKRAGLVI